MKVQHLDGNSAPTQTTYFGANSQHLLVVSPHLRQLTHREQRSVKFNEEEIKKEVAAPLPFPRFHNSPRRVTIVVMTSSLAASCSFSFNEVVEEEWSSSGGEPGEDLDLVLVLLLFFLFLPREFDLRFEFVS